MIKTTQMPGLFDYVNRMDELQVKALPLDRLDSVVPWERFRKRLETALVKEPKGPGGRPRYDEVKMFKVLVAQRFYGLSDEQTEIWIMDRLSFQKFVGLTLADKVPDANTIWDFREAMGQEILDKCFEDFWSYLKEQGIEAKEGKVVDASFVEVPRQRNTREENAVMKQGKTPVEWENQPHKLQQKDVDARWTKKGNEAHYGYKDHVKVDVATKLIQNYEVTDAAVHDSQMLEPLVSQGDGSVHADSAYRSEEIEEKLGDKKIESQICEKGYRNHPLTEEQKASNRTKSKIRCRIEHVFGYVTNSMGNFYLEYIGKVRVSKAVTLINLIYNMARYEQIMRLQLT
jgi:IS5 family transposase